MQKMVHEVLNFIKKDSEGGLQYNLKCVQKHTAAATVSVVRVSERMVRWIAAFANDSNFNFLPVFQKPGKKRITRLDSFDLGIIKRCTHNFHLTGKELPTIDLLLNKLKRDISFEGSHTTSNAWGDGNTKGVKNNISKGQHLVMLVLYLKVFWFFS